ncbi:MAG: PHP domain-containing protein [Clostridia bacterium]|nr:PHP domain-containing protein [Clostridia bacterium]
MAIDLHVHTTASGDGDFSPKKVVEIAKEKNIQAIAITDHDTINGVKEGLLWGKRHGLEVIPGCEFYTEDMGKWLHLLGYFIDYKSQELSKFTEKIEEERKKTVRKQMDKLKKAGLFLELGDLYKSNLKPMFHNYANVIFADSRNKDNDLVKKYLEKENPIVSFCMDWLVPGKPFNAYQYTPKASDIIKLIKNIGGVPVLAHPGALLKEEEDYIIDDLMFLGLEGIEIYTSWHNERNEEHYNKYCLGKDLIITCGSDFHGSLKPKAKMGEIKHNTYDVVEELRKRSN